MRPRARRDRLTATVNDQKGSDKAVHDALRQMCEDIAASQQQEIETMQRWLRDWCWLRDWYGVTYPPEMRMDGAQTCQERAYHPELVQLCDDIEAVQLREIGTMADWLCEWYDRCRFARRTAA